MALDLETKSIDFTMAHPQAVLKTDVFMETPWGYSLDTADSQHMHCLKLLRNLHGLKDGGYNWFECLKGGLLARGFKQSQTDPCLFVRGTLIMVVYVDDVIIAGKSISDIALLLQSLAK